MFQKYFPFILIALLVWYLPELYLSAHAFSTGLINDASIHKSFSVEVKVAKRKQILPEKYAVLAPGERNMRVELNSTEYSFIRSGLTDDNGVAIIDRVLPGTYAVRIAEDPGLSESEVNAAETSGLSVLDDSALFSTSLPQITVKKDMYIVPIIR